MSSIFNRFISLDVFKKSKSPNKNLKMSEEITNNENGSQPQEQAPAPEANSDQHQQEAANEKKEDQIVVEPQADTKPDDVEAKQTDDQTADQTDDQTKEETKENREEPQEAQEKAVSVGTSTTVVIENQDVVSSTTSSKARPPKVRRASYQASRAYAGSFQNYGLAYLPYKSNFEPSEDARRRADEFLKTLKL